MAETFFGIDIRRLVGGAFRGNVPTFTLVKPSGATREDSLTRRAGEETHAIEGIYRASSRKREGTRVVELGENFLIFGASLPTGVRPATGDVIRHQGQDFAVSNVRFNSFEASYICEVAA